MSDPPPQRPDRPPLHTLLDAATMRRMESVRRIALARGECAQAIGEDMRDVLLARHPALPLPMIGGAVASLQSEGRPQPPRPRAVRRFARRLGFGSVYKEDAP